MVNDKKRQKNFYGVKSIDDNQRNVCIIMQENTYEYAIEMLYEVRYLFLGIVKIS